jgi:hypothetical protein
VACELSKGIAISAIHASERKPATALPKGVKENGSFIRLAEEGNGSKYMALPALCGLRPLEWDDVMLF